jgi:2-polyprenyl-6-methoxyphenol hydroxylase-like FAD-dependent oxidoreductase
MKIIIAGAGAVGTHLAKLLSREKIDCTLIDDDEERLAGLGDYDVMTYHAQPTSIQALKDAGVDGADLLVGVTPEESANIPAAHSDTPSEPGKQWHALTTTNTCQYSTPNCSVNWASTHSSTPKYWLHRTSSTD